MTEPIILDGVIYRVRMKYPGRERSFELLSGKNAGTSLAVREIRDLLGTAYSFKMEIEADPAYPQDYDNFYWAISAPVDYHVIVLPFGQTTMGFEAKVTSGTDIDYGVQSGHRRYKGLTINFTPMQPQRTP